MSAGGRSTSTLTRYAVRGEGAAEERRGGKRREIKTWANGVSFSPHV
jgi:hypothetical protein